MFVSGLALIAVSPPALGAPMVTGLATVRAEARIVVVGTLASTRSGLLVDVEYALRGKPGRGQMTVGESPDGRVFVDLDPAKNRVVAFIDSKNRLRWVGRPIAGPSLEKGVIRLEGFFDYNAHNVEPGVMTMAQLKSYLASGKLVQVYRANLTFADGKGGLTPTARSFKVEYDAIARNTTVVGLPMTCLDDGRMSSPTWGRFRLFFYCRERSRTLTLSGEFTGVDTANGEILATAVPTAPYLYEREFDRYIKDGTATAVERIVEVAAGGKVWKWRAGKELVAPDGRVLRSRGGSSGSKRKAGKTIAYETYRFAGVSFTVTHPGQRSAWASNDFFMLQLSDGNGYASCSLVDSAGRRACKLRHVAPQWQRASPRKRAAATEKIAVQVAERFIRDNGYTDQPAAVDRSNISREALESGDVSERLAHRHATLESRAHGVSAAAAGWYVVFRYKGQATNPHGRAVWVDSYGRAVKVEHQDFVLDRCGKKLGKRR